MALFQSWGLQNPDCWKKAGAVGLTPLTRGQEDRHTVLCTPEMQRLADCLTHSRLSVSICGMHEGVDVGMGWGVETWEHDKDWWKLVSALALIKLTVQPRTSQIPSLALRVLISKIRTSPGSQLFYDVLGFGENPNDRMISVHFQGKPFSVTITQV